MAEAIVKAEVADAVDAKRQAPMDRDYTDREVALNAVKQDGCLPACAPRLRSDKAVVLEVVKKSGLALKCADTSLRSAVS